MRPTRIITAAVAAVAVCALLVAGAFAASLPEPRREQLRQRLRSRLLGEGPDRAITLQARAWAVLGVVGSR